jgi:putative ABC transport system permease protein
MKHRIIDSHWRHGEPMSLWRQLTRGARALRDRQATDRDVSDELYHYVEQATAELIARGWSPHAARRAAQREVGNMTVAHERVRSYGWENAVETVVADVRYAARRLRRNPGFTIVSAITLALGIGATTAIFSAVNPMLFEPLPYPNAYRVAIVSDVSADGGLLDVTFGTYRELLQRSHSFDAMAAFKAWQPTMIGSAEPEQLAGQRVGANYFRALGVPPVLGRDFEASDDRPNGPNVAILSNALWHRRFAGDASIVGRAVKLDDNDYLVIGVMPRGFENVPAPLAELWAPLQYATSFGPDTREWGHHLRLVARVRPGVTVEQAGRELNAIARAPESDFPRVPWASLTNGLRATSLQADVTRGVRPALLAVLGAVLLVLAIACVNVTNLMLARGAHRRGEFAMRAALGAARGRLIRQLLVESMLLAAIGGVLGMFVAAFGVRTLVALSPPGLPRIDAIHLDVSVFVFGLIVTTVIGVLVGVIPALHASRADLLVGLQQSSQRASVSHQRTRGVLVVAEVALALVLLVSAGLLLRSIERVFAVAVGFDSSRLLTMRVQETGHRFDADTVRSRFFSDALTAVSGVPGVTAAAFTSLLPLSGDIDIYGVHFENDHEPKDDGAALRYAVTPEYFSAMRIPLRRGRLLTAHDGPGAPRAALINESFATRKFPGTDPIGQRFHFGPEEGPWYTIVGIVGDVKQSSLDLDQPAALYVPSTQWHWVDNAMSLVVRARGDAPGLTSAIRQAIWSVDKNQPIVRIATMERLVEQSIADRHFALILFEAFGFVALMLAATGIYGVLSGSVTERVREIGVRAALGASPSDIVGLVVWKGMTLTTTGVVIGIGGAMLATRAVVSMLFGVSRLDPVTYVSVIALLGAVSIVACGLPALRASRVDPANTLRAE